VLFRNKELRRSMYFTCVEWNGGIYASPTIAGSRPGALIATTWASLMSFGQSGYLEAAQGIADMARVIKKGCVQGSSVTMLSLGFC
jgi:sphinganine-1-phosphate aldolase